LVDLQRELSPIMQHHSDVLKNVYMVSIPIKVTFRYLLDRNAAMDEQYERAELDEIFTQWDPEWKECLIVPFNEVMEDKNLDNKNTTWDWLKETKLVDQVKSQTQDLLNTFCDDEAKEVAEDSAETIEKHKLDWGDWDSYVHFDGEETFIVTLCLYLS
jgi:hypothetical protein